MNICICGGGSLGLVCAGVLTSHRDVKLFLLTKHPQSWSHSISVLDCNNKIYQGYIDKISSNAADVIPNADIILLCQPGFLIEQTLKEIKPYVNEQSIIGSIVSSTGFFFFAHDILGDKAKLFGFQRTPFIARVAEYGHKGNLLGYKKKLNIAIENIFDRERFRQNIERLFLTPTMLLKSFYEAALTNSNPILHTGRLYAMWKDWNGEIYPRCSFFYKEWDIESAQTIICMDKEFMTLLDILHVRKGAIPPLLDYYESTDAESLCQKLQSIPAFQNISSPMIKIDGGWIPDINSRYFTEDFPYGLYFIKKLAEKSNLQIPIINKIYNWGIKWQI